MLRAYLLYNIYTVLSGLGSVPVAKYTTEIHMVQLSPDHHSKHFLVTLAGH